MLKEQDGISGLGEAEKVSDCNSKKSQNPYQETKVNWTITQPGATTTKYENYTRKRKSLDADLKGCYKEIVDRDGIKRLEHDTSKNYDKGPSEMMTEGSKGGLCLAWKRDTEVSLRSFSRNHIDVLVKEEQVKEEWRFTRFYDSPYVHNKSDSWDLVMNLGKDKNYPWLVSGDFNEIMYSFLRNVGVSQGMRVECMHFKSS